MEDKTENNKAAFVFTSSAASDQMCNVIGLS